MQKSGGKPETAAFIAAFLVMIAAAGAAALPAPVVQFIPDKFSQNGSFVAVADPGIYDKSIRVTWSSPDEGLATDMGLFPREGNKWVCYFSNRDAAATCGPTPFRQSFGSGYTFLVNSVDRHGSVGEQEINVSVGRIELTPEVTVSGGRVIMVIYASESTETASFAVYDKTFEKVKDYTKMSKTPYGHFTGETLIDRSGTYYIAFKAENSVEGTFGGEAKKVVIGGGDSGVAMSNDIQASAVSFEVLMNKTQTYTRTGQGGKSYEIKNIGTSNLTGLQTGVDGRLAGKLSVELDDDSLNPNESTYFTVELKGIENAMSLITNVNVTSNGSVVGMIPMRINVSVLGECGGEPIQCPSTNLDVSITPATWTGEFLEGTTARKNFTIQNNEDFLIDIKSTEAGTLEPYITIDRPMSVPARSSRQISVSFSPISAGSYSGTITINTDKGPASIIMYAVFYEDISGDIEDARTDLLSLENDSIDESVIETIETQLDNAESDLDFGSYKLAASEYAAARAQLDIIEEMETGGTGNGGTPAPPVDMSTIIILIIVLIVLGGVFMYLKKFRGKGKNEFEEELEEEGY